MSEMIERLAKRLYNLRPGHDGDRVWRSNGCETRPYLDAAREVLDELRRLPDSVEGAMNRHASNGMVNWRELHNAMIDEALR